MGKVLFIKNREYDVKLEYQEKLTRHVAPCLPTCSVDLDVLPSAALVKWHNKFRRLLVRWEKKLDHYYAMIDLASVLIIWRLIATAST